MKLYNRTSYDDEMLRRVLRRTASLIGARSSDVVIRVAWADSLWGDVSRADFVMRYHLTGKRLSSDSRAVSTDRAFMRLFVCRSCRVPRERAEEIARFFYHLCLHEWSHVLDHQKGGVDIARRQANGRRIRHDDRPEEIRAEDRATDAMARLKQQDLDLIDELAVAFSS